MVRGSLTRKNRNRLRTEEPPERLDPDPDRVDPKRFRRCLDVFEEHCVVTESVRNGIDVLVEVSPGVADAEEAVAVGAL